MTNLRYGNVYLVGAGPGDPDLLTVRAKTLLSKCGALVYDSLVPNEIINMIPQSTESHFVGKRRGHHSLPQAKTNAVLLDMAKRHDCVVRLKGGDPFLFGRGGEEASYLVNHGVPVEVVPGVTAGIAAPAFVGIPVTHRLAGSSVTFVTGHEGFDKRRPSVDWKALAQATDGLVIYMGLHNLRHIVDELIAGGLDPATPSAVIQQGTVVGQRFVKAPLRSLFEIVKTMEFASPSIIIIGQVVNYQVDSCAPVPADVTMPIPFH